MHEMAVSAVKSDLFFYGMIAFLVGGVICCVLEYRETATGMFVCAAIWGMAAFLAPFARVAIS